MYNSISNFSVAIIQSIAQSESLAFAVACILESQDKDNLLSRVLLSVQLIEIGLMLFVNHTASLFETIP